MPALQRIMNESNEERSMNIQTLLQIVAALSITHLLHALLELGNVGAKLRRLRSVVDSRPVPKYRFNADTRPKVYAFGLLLPSVLFLVSYFVLSVRQVPTETCAWISIIVTISLEVINVVGYDRYHIGIEKLIKKFTPSPE